MVSAKNNYLKRIGYLFLFVLITASLVGCKIQGNVSEQGQGVKDVTVNLTGTKTSTTLTRDSGNFKFNFLDNGEYTVSLSKAGFTFEPVSQKIVIASRFDVKTINFEAISNKIPIADPQNITLEEDSQVSITLTGSDQENDPLAFIVQTNPEHGQLTETAPELIYTPSENYNGSDSFTFVVNDGQNNSEPAVITIEVTPVMDLPTITLSADPTEINKGETATLTWSSTNADTCTIEPNVGDVDLNGSVIVTPQETTLYTITATNAEGTATDTAIIMVAIPPEVTLTANPLSIDQGGTSTLTWTSANAETCVIEPDIGYVALNDSITIMPKKTTTYIITASNAGITATSSVEITVKSKPAVYLSVSKEVINFGESIILTWSSSPAQKAYLNNGIGEVLASGSLTLTPEYTTTYTLTSINDNLTSVHSISVKVLGNPPQQQPEGSFGEQYNGLIPTDASLESYDPNRFTVLTGFVKNINGNPIENVKVEIINHPEYGSALSDETGRFSIPAEGGILIKISYIKDNYLTIHRRKKVPVKDIVTIDTVAMLQSDAAETIVTFDGNPETIITHKSTEFTDESGPRSYTMVFTGDNRAYEIDKYGNKARELTSITTRATEYVTPASMPAMLPPTSAFTYCAELEAEGIENIEFDKPIINYVDNFLNFRVGGIVPVGYYDRKIAEWVASENGVVVRLLDTDSDGIVDALDATGDDLPDDLNNNGSTSDEVIGLTTPTYQHGTTYWRFQTKHFTPFDLNWPINPPWDAIPPNPKGVPAANDQKDEPEDCNTPSGSYVEDRSRILHDDITIMGTDLTLHFASNRIDPQSDTNISVIDVPVSGDTVPPSLKSITVDFIVASQKLSSITLDPLPNQKAEFAWDGKDDFGYMVKTPVRAYINIGFVYDNTYYEPGAINYIPAWAQPGFIPTSVIVRDESTLWKIFKRNIAPLSSFQAIKAGTLGNGWTISSHHYFNPDDRSTLYKGDGSKIQTHNLINTLNNVDILNNAHVNNGVWELEMDSKGNFYIIAGYYDDMSIKKVDKSGEVTNLIYGDGIGLNPGGDGGPSVEGKLAYPIDIAVDNDGNIFIADSGDHRIRKIDNNGIITTVAGKFNNGGWGSAAAAAVMNKAGAIIYGSNGDGGPATEAELNNPVNIAVDNWGNLFIADKDDNRIRKVDTNGIISTVVGTGINGYSGDNELATEARLSHPSSITIDDFGNLFITDQGNYRVRKVDTSGIITTVAGTGVYGYSGDEGPSTEAGLEYPANIAVDDLGNLFFTDGYRIRKVNTSGIITTVAGTGENGYCEDGWPATEAKINPSDIVLDYYGNFIFIDDSFDFRKFKSWNGISNFTEATRLFRDPNGLGYIMDKTGKHIKTIDLSTGATLHSFAYQMLDNQDYLTSITDQFGNQTIIDRTSNGTPYAITSPDGLTTLLNIDGNNHLTKVTLPDDNFYNFEYSPEGFLTAKTKPNNNRFVYNYSNLSGRVIDTQDEEGGQWSFSRMGLNDGSIINQVITKEGNITTYKDKNHSTGKYTSEITNSAGGQTFYTRSADGLSVEKNLSCGMSLKIKYGLDPEHKYKFIKEKIKSTPSGHTSTTQQEILYEDTNSDDIPDLITKTVSVNNKTTSSVHNVLSSIKTITSPEGRQATLTYDPDTLVVNTFSIPNLNQTDYLYNTTGRIESITTGARTVSYTYDSNGYLDSITNPENHTISYVNDKAGRVTSVHRSDGSSLEFTYDKNGNMIVLTNSDTINHTFGYNKVSLWNNYTTPLSGSYSFTYDKDRRLIQKDFPSGKAIYWDYSDPDNLSDKSRLWAVITPEGNVNYTYSCSTKIESITKGTESINYTYDASLITSESLSGLVNQTLSLTYNNDFNVETFTYANDTVSYSYDNDGLLTGSGDYTIFRNAQNGLPESLTDNTFTLDRTFNAYGELSQQSINVNANDLFELDLTTDNNGRITSKTETVEGTSSSYAYTYDQLGRLLTVTKDATLVEEYRYDLKGTRNYEMNTLRGITGRTFTYSDEDHLLTAGSDTYQYDLDGFLASKTIGADTTAYTYSSRGELLNITLPDSRYIEYKHDPTGRRIAKKINGVTTEKYLWAGKTTLLAVFDQSDNLTTRFEYADGRMPVSMMKQGIKYYLICDQVGSLRVVSDSAGNIVKQIDYDSFGNIINDTDPAFTVPFGFAGGLHDRDAGLVRFGFRDYDTDIGRWTAKDPIGFAGGDSDLWGYVLNDPVNLIDPTGESWWKIIDIGTTIGGIAYENYKEGQKYLKEQDRKRLNPIIENNRSVYLNAYMQCLSTCQDDPDPCSDSDCNDCYNDYLSNMQRDVFDLQDGMMR